MIVTMCVSVQLANRVSCTRGFMVVTFGKIGGELKPVSVHQKFHSASTTAELAASILIFFQSSQDAGESIYELKLWRGARS